MKAMTLSRTTKIGVSVLIALGLVSILIGAVLRYRLEQSEARLLFYGTNAQITELLEAGADPNVRVRGQQGDTPLHGAAVRDDSQPVRTLISHGANVNARNDFNETPLYKAAAVLHVGNAAILLESGADVNAKGYGSDTPMDVVFMLHHSVESGEMIALLKRYGGVTQYK